ncbi:VWA domain-containing protein [Rhodobacteraceae bacterium NNCM2]|nr:VWA domain-containing protein [Coraliihabitans acroporae]
MTGLGEMLLMRPAWLLAIPLILLVAWVGVFRHGALGAWRKVLDPRLIPALTSLGHISLNRNRLNIFAAMTAAVVGAAALSGPATRSDAAPAFRNLDLVLLVIDMSESMTRGGAFDDAQAAAAQILAEATGRPIAIILFTVDAYLASAPTEDPATLETIVAVLDAETMPDAGSRPDRALRLAREIVEGSGAPRSDVLLISDGGGVDAETLHEAERLRQAGAATSTVYIGPATQKFGMPAPRPDALEELAEVGQGVFIEPADIATLAHRLNKSGRLVADRKFASLNFDDHGRLLLVFALLPLVILFRRRL